MFVSADPKHTVRMMLDPQLHGLKPLADFAMNKPEFSEDRIRTLDDFLSKYTYLVGSKGEYFRCCKKQDFS